MGLFSLGKAAGKKRQPQERSGRGREKGYRKRIYPKHFTSKMTDADSEASETCVWLDFAIDCGYISIEEFRNFTQQYEEVGKMLGSMIRNPEKFKPKTRS